MSRQFSIPPVENAEQAAQLVKHAARFLFSHHYTWMIEWAKSKCEDSIKKLELDLIRHRAAPEGTRTQDIERAEEYLAHYKAIQHFLACLYAYACHRDTELDAPAIVESLLKSDLGPVKRSPKRKDGA